MGAANGRIVGHPSEGGHHPKGVSPCRIANIPRTGDFASVRPVEVETTPSEPPEVTAALVSALAEDAREPDPWWRAGVAEALGE